MYNPMTVLWLKWLVADLSLQSPRFMPRLVHVGLVVLSESDDDIGNK
jgi:hypothetical protein